MESLLTIRAKSSLRMWMEVARVSKYGCRSPNPSLRVPPNPPSPPRKTNLRPQLAWARCNINQKRSCMAKPLAHSSARLLEYDQLRTWLSGFAQSELGHGRVHELEPTIDREWIERQ